MDSFKDIYFYQLASDESGQSTLEYAIVFAGFLSMVIALGVMWDFISGAMIVRHALESASHEISGVLPQVVCDVFLY